MSTSGGVEFSTSSEPLSPAESDFPVSQESLLPLDRELTSLDTVLRSDITREIPLIAPQAGGGAHILCMQTNAGDGKRIK